MSEVNHLLWKQSAIGKDLTESEARELYMCSKREHYKKDETLFVEGNDAVALFLIVSGDVNIEKTGANNKTTHIATLSTGAIVGEMSLLTQEKRGAAARIATDTATILRVDWVDFEKLLDDNHAAAYKLMVALARLLAGRLKRINLKVAELMSTAEPGQAEKLEEFAAFKKKLMRDWSF